ncbi:MAG TPA: AraD1 family protein [Dongiaceae bacterium]|jgi:hypothetical protein
MRLIQYQEKNGRRRVGVVTKDGIHAHPLKGVASVYELANLAIGKRKSLEKLVEEKAKKEKVDYVALIKAGRVLSPIDHPEPARLLVTGTGLTHIGSADARNKMHVTTHGGSAPESDSMKIFRMGIDGGKPGKGKIGVMPEWFFKGVGTCVVPPGAPLPLPGFALAGAEEPEIVGIYINDKKGQPRRIGYTLGNEFSDHVTEGKNYLYLAHSKLRACALGPELLIGTLPANVRGTTRILRKGKVIWQDEFLSGEEHMSHSVANLEHFHFRYPMFRRPGDLHAYFFGAAVLSHAAGIKTAPGDEFVIEAPAFGQPLRNRMEKIADEGLVNVTAL